MPDPGHEPYELVITGPALEKGDQVQIGGLEGTFFVTGVDTGRGASRTSVVRVRCCPECRASYGGLHPDGECRRGLVERIMES